MAILYSRVQKDMECPKEVMIWNYFDHEHVVGTHYKHYEIVRIIEEMDNWAMCERTRRLPLIRIKIASVDFAWLKSPHHIKAFHFAHGLRHEHDVMFTDLEGGRCLVVNEYRLHVPFFLKPLQPLWQRVTKRWFHVQWDEDVPMRLRRWRVWRLGFRDFVGLDYVNKGTARPELIEDRPYPIELPVPKSTTIRTKGFPRLFDTSDEVGYSK